MLLRFVCSRTYTATAKTWDLYLGEWCCETVWDLNLLSKKFKSASSNLKFESLRVYEILPLSIEIVYKYISVQLGLTTPSEQRETCVLQPKPDKKQRDKENHRNPIRPCKSNLMWDLGWIRVLVSHWTRRLVATRRFPVLIRLSTLFYFN